MISAVTSALMMCSTGDSVIADKIALEAIRQDTNVIVALAVGIMESGLQPGNPMGVRGCYPEAKRKNRRNDSDCIRIGVASIRNRLLDARASLPSKQEMRTCAKSGNMTTCRALIAYNGADKGRKFVYARKTMGIIRSIHRLAGIEMSGT